MTWFDFAFRSHDPACSYRIVITVSSTRIAMITIMVTRITPDAIATAESYSDEHYQQQD
ncbi:MAG TPA: hypothetical protein VMH01_06570 [Puia sp.]|nr:hypothetical protein [Puia sp.]